MRLLGVLELSSVWHFDAKHVRGMFSVAADGISSPLQFACCSTRLSVAGAGPAGCGHIRLYFGVGLELMRNAIATSSERTYKGHFIAWVDVRMAHVDTAVSDCGFAKSGCVGGQACGGVRFALSEDGRRNSFVGGGGNTRGVAA